MTKKCIFRLFIFTIFAFLAFQPVNAQGDESAEPTTVSNVSNAVLPWGAQRILPGKIPAEFDEAFEKMLAEAGGKISGGSREFIVWGAKLNAAQIKSELQANFRKEGWEYETAAIERDVEFFSLLGDGASKRAIMGYFISGKEILVCALMEIKAADSTPAQTTRSPLKTQPSPGGGLIGRWFRTVGGSVISSTGKTTLKGSEDFTFEFFADGTVEYARKKEVLNFMQCRITASDTARGRYSLAGNSLTINLGAMKSVGTNSCNAQENFNRTLGSSTLTAIIEIEQLEDITRPDKPLTMCFDGKTDVCYEKQR